ncbi:uncharacterized protein [Chelonus insularis]|uniref:uncharacterized protein n=1 Tax=Chelonus insularis TaxID=460826 RepID=UPI0015883C29|nr:uncharacterized protein LOC118071520 [Chelonus insularis]
MGLTCYICRRKASKSDRISLHKFPKNPILRNKWITACNLSSNDNLTYIYICSLHFNSNDVDRGNQFQTRCTLRSNAVPSIDIPNKMYNNENANTSNIDASCKNSLSDNILNIGSENIAKNNEFGIEHTNINSAFNDMALNVDTFDNVIAHANQIEILTDNDDNKTENVQESPLPTNMSGDENNSPQLCDDVIKRRRLAIAKATAASEVDQHFVQSESIYTTPKRRVFEPRYISEIKTPDFESPRRTKRILSFVREADKKKSKMIKALREKNRKLEKRICLLEEIVAHLKKKNMVTCP